MVPEVLTTTVSTSAAVSAAYYVVRLIRHRFLCTLPERAGRELIAEGLTNQPSPEVVDLAKRAIRDIEKSEHVPIEDLTPEQAGAYVSDLEGFVRTRFSEGLQIDKTRGEKLLDELRQAAGE